MLELKNLTRTYKPKKGVPVQALKNVSLSFEDKGMVFVLGKSGSGKSTLLNLIGGLDFADSGEIIIDGKSSKDFKEKDYDSYRNTYIGFVFQEYNILNEFTVGENISLALELQSQKGDTGRLEEILKEVDLEGYGDRKPNELSGGQKQRVAIARAIIKNPKIVMADEPTGALDSEIGKAIFDTLKRLSQDRLVIVVSHDREFAEEYGDRIIELADGEVISDETKVKAQGERDAETNNLESVAGDTAPSSGLKKSRLPYKRALAMGAKTLSRKRLRLAVTIILCFFSFLSFGLVVTAMDFSKVDTEANVLKNMRQDGLVVRSALTYNEIYKGSLFGASYNDLQKLREQTGIDFQGVAKEFNRRANYSYYNRSALGDGEYYSSDITGSLPAEQDLFDSQCYTLYGRLPENENEFVISKYIYEKMALAGLIIDAVDTGEDTIIRPEEIADIQSFLDKQLYLSSPLTGEPSLVVGVVDTKFNSDGRFDVFKEPYQEAEYDRKGYNLKREFYDAVAEGYHTIAFVYPQAYQKWEDSAKVQLELDNVTESSGRFYINKNDFTEFSGVANDEVIRNIDKILWIDGNGERRELANNEIILGADIAIQALYPSNKASYKVYIKNFKTYFNGMVSLAPDTSEYDLRNGGAGEAALLEEAESISLQELEKYKDYCREINYVFDYMLYFRRNDQDFYRDLDINTMQEKHWRWSYACYLGRRENNYFKERVGGYYNNVTGRQSGEYIINILGNRWYLDYKLSKAPGTAQRMDAADYDISYSDAYYRYLPIVEFVDAPVIVGVYFSEDDFPSNLVINNKMYEESECLEKSIYNYFISPKINDKSKLIKLAQLNFDTQHLRGFEIQNYGVDAAFEWDFAFNNVLKPIFGGVAGVLGVLSILLMGGYITSSINAQKRQIGMLRALGATKSDVFAIFANESAIIAGITLVLSVIGTWITSIVFNAVISNARLITLNILNFGILQVVLLSVVCIGVAVLASAIPLYKLSKKKPVDSIQDR